jgi:hypothetical protein
MPDTVRDLDATQRWMLAAITNEPGATVELSDGPSDVVGESGSLSASQRIDIYRRGYRARLVDCLRKTHPGLRHALGPEVFDAFALDYLAAHPSRSYTLGRLDEQWPQHLDATRPDRDAPLRERWPDFLVDLVHLEGVFQDVYDGPGVEHQPIVGPADLPREPCGEATVQLVECLRLLNFRFPVARYLGAVRAGEEPPLPMPAESFVVVNRRGWVVTLTELRPIDHAALVALANGERIADAARIAGTSVAQVWQLVQDWAALGFLQAIDQPTRVAPLTTGEVFA